MEGYVFWGSWVVGGVGWVSWLIHSARSLIRRQWKTMCVMVSLSLLALTVYLVISIKNPMFIEQDGIMTNALAIDHNSVFPSTVNSHQTIRGGFLITGTLLLAIPLFQANWQRYQIRTFISVLAMNAALIAAVGTFFHLSGDKLLLGIVEPAGGGSFGTFHSKNTWSAYAVLGASQAASLFAYHKKKTRDIFSKKSPVLYYASLLPIVSITLLLNHSRAGLFAMTFCILGAGMGRSYQKLRRRRKSTRDSSEEGRRFLWIKRSLVTLLILFASFCVVNTTQKDFVEIARRSIIQWDNGLFVGGRLPLYRDCISMGKARPWLGWGLGSFQQVFPNFQQEDRYRKSLRADGEYVWMPGHYGFAHNDFLQFWVELGVIGLGLLVLPIIGFVLYTFWSGRANPISLWLGMGCFAVLIIALVDFPFASVAIQLTFMAQLVLAGKYALLSRHRSMVSARPKQSEAESTSIGAKVWDGKKE
jgi:O-antigen ligase